MFLLNLCLNFLKLNKIILYIIKFLEIIFKTVINKNFDLFKILLD